MAERIWKKGVLCAECIEEIPTEACAIEVADDDRWQRGHPLCWPCAWVGGYGGVPDEPNQAARETWKAVFFVKECIDQQATNRREMAAVFHRSTRYNDSDRCKMEAECFDECSKLLASELKRIRDDC